MSDATDNWALAIARLPDSLDQWRVLEVGDGGADGLLDGRGIKDLVNVSWPSEDIADPGPYHLAYLAAGLDGELHPLAVGAWLWWRLHTGGSLVLEGTVLADPEKTAFSDFVVDPSGSDQRWRWIPGRMTLRWMVENSGFDDVVWLDERPGNEPGTVEVALQAVKGERGPAVDLTRQPLAPRNRV
jgi:hypothetical protein